MFKKYPLSMKLLKNDTSESILLHFIVPDLLSTLRFYEQKTHNKGNFQGSEIWRVWKNRTKDSKVDRKQFLIKNVNAKKKKVIQRKVSTHGLIKIVKGKNEQYSIVSQNYLQPLPNSPLIYCSKCSSFAWPPPFCLAYGNTGC